MKNKIAPTTTKDWVPSWLGTAKQGLLICNSIYLIVQIDILIVSFIALTTWNSSQLQTLLKNQ